MRCPWAIESELIYVNYHDEEWGIPEYNDQKLFEMLCLEGAQAGLSWLTVLKKRAHYRKVFDNFDATKMANYTQEKYEQLLQDEGIIRNRLKIKAFIQNAQAFLTIQQTHGSFAHYIWSFVDHEPIIHDFHSMEEVPVMDEISIKMSKQLKKDGFTFVGPTICYAYMQAVGLVNDHLTSCAYKNRTT